MKDPTKNENDEDDDSANSANESLRDQLRALPGVVWILCVGVFINRFGTFVIPFLTLYLTDKGYSTWQIGWVFAITAVGGFLALVLGGRLSDLIGRKNTMSIGLIGGGLSMLVLWQADSFPAYLAASLLVGVTHSLYHPAAQSLLMDVLPAERRVTGFAVVRWAINLGFAAGMAAGGWLAELSYDWLFIGDCVTSVTYGIIAALTLPHGVRTTVKKSKWGPALRHMLANRPFLILFVAQFLAVSTFFHWGSVGALMLEDFGYKKNVYGMLMAVNGLMIAFFEIPLSQLGRRLDPRKFIGLGFFLCGFGVWTNIFATGWVIVFVSLIIFTVGEMMSLPIASAYLAELSPEKMRGRYNAAMGFTWNFSHAIAPAIGLLLYESYPIILWLGMLGIGVVSAGLMLVGIPPSERSFEK